MIVKNILRFFRRFLRAQEAVSALEYAILVGVIVAGVGAALMVFSDNIGDALEDIGGDVETAAGGAGPAALPAAGTRTAPD